MSNPITLEQYVTSARNGKEMREKLTDGREVHFRVYPPSQEALAKIRDKVGKALSGVGGDGESIKDGSSVVDLLDIETMCLQACLRELDEETANVLINDLEEDSKLKDRCIRLCNVEMFVLGEDAEGKQ